MTQIKWRYLVGQERIKEVFEAAFGSNTLGHAYLFCGDSGAGTFAAALDIAMAIHCLSEHDKPCTTCVSCKKILGLNHPDFHVIMPLSLQKEHKGSDGRISDVGWDEVYAKVRQRIIDPFALQEFTALPSIPVEWIRECMHAIRRGAVQNGKNVVIIDGVETMQPESANAMLKTLEEPPAGTILILCTARLHAVLPTIISRCQLCRFSALPPDIIRTELSTKYSIAPDDARLNDVQFAGSIGKARQLLADTTTDEGATVKELLRLITLRETIPLFETIDQLSIAGDYGLYERMFIRIMYGVRNAFFTNLGDAGNYIMGDNALTDIFGMIATPQAAEQVVALCETAIRRLRARANSSLVLAQFAFSVMEFFNEQKQ